MTERASDLPGKGPLGSLPPAVAEELLSGSTDVRIGPGHVIYEPWPALISDGELRVFITAPDGRQLTVAYLHPGDIVGLAGLAGRRHPVGFQATTEGRLVQFDRDRFEHMLDTEPRLFRPALALMGRYMDAMLDEMALAAFSDAGHRVVHHLLALAVPDGTGRLVCTATHQQLADAAGTVRETVTHRLGELRDAGVVELTARGIVVVDPERLGRHPYRRRR